MVGFFSFAKYYDCSISVGMEKRAFGELELAVLKILKDGKKKTVKEVHRILGGKYTSIMTVMSRLAGKNLLVRERVGLFYEYWLKEAYPLFIKKKLSSLKPTEILCYLFESGEAVSDEELQQMEEMINKIKKTRKT